MVGLARQQWQLIQWQKGEKAEPGGGGGAQMPAVGQSDGGRPGVPLLRATFEKPKQEAKQLFTIAGT